MSQHHLRVYIRFLVYQKKYSFSHSCVRMADLSQVNADWHSVSLNLLKQPYDLELWQKFIHHAEHYNGSILDKTASDAQVHLLRVSYEAFLLRFPLLSKYWSAYAEWEFKLGHIQRANAVYSKGIAYVGHDVNYWIDFLRFKLRVIGDNTNELLELFEEARFKIGFNYYASDFYLLYLSFLRTYSTVDNGYDKKSVWLFRSITEIPLYNYSTLYKEFFRMISPKSLTFDILLCLLPESQEKQWKAQSKNNLVSISKKLEKVFTDAYVVLQYESFQIFSFEKSLIPILHYSSDILSTNEIEIWVRYLDFAEQKYPFLFMYQLYEKCLISTAKYTKLVEKFSDYLLLKGKFNLCRQVLKRFVFINHNRNNIELLLRLVDIELYLGRYFKARDIVVKYLEINDNAPNRVYLKLIEIESLLHYGDGDYLCALTFQIITHTKSLEFIDFLLTSRVSDELLMKLIRLLREKDNDLGSRVEKIALVNEVRLQKIYRLSLTPE